MDYAVALRIECRRITNAVAGYIEILMKKKTRTKVLR